MTLVDDAPTVPPADEAVSSWGPETPPAPQFRHFLFKIAGQSFTHLDLTGAEAEALEKRFGFDWGDLRPMGSLTHRMAILETFLARTDPAGASARVRGMTVKQLDDAVEVVWGSEDDLPTQYVDGVPKAVDAP